MKNRLKLFDDNLWLKIERKDKVKFRNIAFKNKRTISELNRILIKAFIKIYDSEKIKSGASKNEDELNLILEEIGGILNK